MELIKFKSNLNKKQFKKMGSAVSCGGASDYDVAQNSMFKLEDLNDSP